MNCLSLFSLPIADYVAQFRARRDELYVFQHIPKTAGTSIHAQLDLLRNGFHWLGDSIQDHSWNDFIQLNAIQKFRWLRGHIKSYHLDDLDQKNIPYAACCYLREPISQTISHFRYCHSENCPDHRMFRERFPTPKKFISEYLKPNFSTTYMVGECDSVDEAMDKIGRRFAFVGLKEFYNTSMYLMMQCLGQNFVPQPMKNVTQSDPKVDQFLTAEVVDFILNEFAIDIAVHAFFARQYGSIADRIVNELCLKSGSYKQEPETIAA